ncbi:MAG: M10 family metallopeptidase C-terminal domain-containing protein, partial [Alphaproteobacteria bacterium]
MATASNGVVGMTGNDLLDTLIIGDKWNDVHPVTFFFDDGGADAADDWFDEARDALREALDIYSTYIDLTFQEVDDEDDANLVLRMASWEDLPGTATATFEYPDEDDPSAVGQFPYEWGLWTPWHLQVGGYAMATVLHELGHALGLGHPHDDGGLSGIPFPGVDEPGDVGDGHNTGIYTVMSYLQTGQFWAPEPATSDLGWGYQGSPMALDIAALQHIYGENPTTGAGNNTYTLPTVETDGTYWRSIWDTGGTDMMRHTGSAPATLDLRAAPLTGPDAGGYLSQVDGIAGGFTIANGVTIEWAEGGSGDDDIYGNGADNELAGRGGNDGIAGHGGDDLIDGGAGNDIMNGGTGDDTMIGGDGNDQFVIDSAGDVMHEKAGGGIDTVVAPFTHTLAVDFENLHLSESPQDGVNGYGNAVANQIIGNSGGNRLEGRGGDDFVNGGAGRDQIDGGSGKDTLHGANGDDFIDGGADAPIVLTPNKPGGDDRGSLTTHPPEPKFDDFASKDPPAKGDNDDELHGGNGQDTLVGRGGDDRLYGDSGDDSLVGGNGADLLDGGFQNDSMAGGSGDDVYVVDMPLDIVVEGAGEGIDGVFSSIDHTLATNVENLTLTGWNGSHIDGTGNKLANWINGNDGNNVLMGLAGDDLLVGNGGFDWIEGGAGVDLILGGQGDDMLYGDDAPAMVLGPVFAVAGPVYGDTIFGGQGADTLNGRAGDDVLSGDDGDDMLVGEAGADTADGGLGNDTAVGGHGNDSLLGGEGDDSLTGGAGNDVLVGGGDNDYMNGEAGD